MRRPAAQSSFALSWRMLARDWRSGELNILLFALIVAVTSVAAVGFFVDRVERGLHQQAAELIGADLVVTSSRPIRPEFVALARREGLSTVEVMQFRSVVLARGQPQLVEAKAVEEGYPLRGRLRTAGKPDGADSVAAGIPASGEVWVEPRLLQQLGLEVGAVIHMGARSFRVTRLLTYEPDRGGTLFSVAPRVLMGLQDVPATQLIQDGALVDYRLLVAGDAGAVEELRGALRNRLMPGERILSLEEGRPELRGAVEGARRFLGLAALLSVLLAGVAVATSARRFTQRHLDTSALMRCLGARQSTVIRVFSLEMLWLALFATSAGVVLGLLVHAGIVRVLGGLLSIDLPAPSWRPLTVGYGTGVIMMLGFGLPPLLALGRVPPLRVLRHELSGEGIPAWLIYAAVVISLGMMLYWQIDDVRLVLYVFGGMLATLLVLALAAFALVALLGRLRRRVGVAWRFGLANIARRPASSVIQITAFGLGIMLLLLLFTLRSDLLDRWRRSLPPDTPNHFLINVQADQLDGLKAYFREHRLHTPTFYPMVRARLTHINGHPVRASDYESDRARHLVTREFNLSWVMKPRADNTVASGEWWGPADQGKPLLSLETGVAKALGIGLNDRLRFNVNGYPRELAVSNLRKVDWGTFNINFFALVPPGLLEREPASWVTSLYIDPQRKRQLGKLVEAFPNVTVIDVEVIMSRVREILERVSLAVESIFLFTLLAGLAVLYAAIQANQDERRHECAVLRTLGAQKSVLRQGLMAEFVTLGALAGLLGGLFSAGLAWLLAEQVFRFSYPFDPFLCLIGMGLGILIVGIAGVWGTRSVLDRSPLLTLRNTL